MCHNPETLPKVAPSSADFKRMFIVQVQGWLPVLPIQPHWPPAPGRQQIRKLRNATKWSQAIVVRGRASTHDYGNTRSMPTRCEKEQIRSQFSKYRFQNESALAHNLWKATDRFWIFFPVSHPAHPIHPGGYPDTEIWGWVNFTVLDFFWVKLS